LVPQSTASHTPPVKPRSSFLPDLPPSSLLQFTATHIPFAFPPLLVEFFSGNRHPNSSLAAARLVAVTAVLPPHCSRFPSRFELYVSSASPLSLRPTRQNLSSVLGRFSGPWGLIHSPSSLDPPDPPPWPTSVKHLCGVEFLPALTFLDRPSPSPVHFPPSSSTKQDAFSLDRCLFNHFTSTRSILFFSATTFSIFPLLFDRSGGIVVTFSYGRIRLPSDTPFQNSLFLQKPFHGPSCKTLPFSPQFVEILFPQGVLSYEVTALRIPPSLQALTSPPFLGLSHYSRYLPPLGPAS